MRVTRLSYVILSLAVLTSFVNCQGVSVIPGVGTELSKVDSIPIESNVVDEALPKQSSGFFPSVTMILASELGDKTFFIAAILAMRHPKCIVFSGAISALVIMTILSAGMGVALPQLLPRVYTHYASVILFLFFGVKLLVESRDMHEGPSHELKEVEDELRETNEDDLEEGIRRPSDSQRKYSRGFVIPPVMMQALSLTFMAEWGDRSQIATIALAAKGDPIGVTVGAIIGHAICTAFAVIGGKLLASKISERMVTIVGAVLFLVFGLEELISGP